MSNARRPPAGRRTGPAATRPSPGKSSNPLPLLLAVGAGVVILLIVAIVATLGGDGDDATVTPGVEETRPVTVTGDALPELEGGDTDAAVGQRAPVVEGASFDGTPVTIGEGPAVLVFLAHWCPHCQREVPVIVDHLRTAEVPESVDLVAVATSTTESRPNYPPSAWLEREGLDLPVLVDDDRYSAAAAYGLSAFPFFVVLNGDGEVVVRASGELSTEQFDALVAAAAAPSG